MLPERAIDAAEESSEDEANVPTQFDTVDFSKFLQVGEYNPSQCLHAYQLIRSMVEHAHSDCDLMSSV